MFEDFGQYNLDRLNTKEIKSQDVIKKHSLDPSLDNEPIMKANTILSVGDELQKFSVLLSFPELFKFNSAECFKYLVPKMQQSLPSASVDYHFLAASAVRTLMEERIITPELFVSNFLHTVLSAMDNKDLSVSSTWSETLYYVLDYLPSNVLQMEVLPLIIGKLDIGIGIATRVTSCRILKQLIKSCDTIMLKRDIVGLVVSLCQDISADVRAAGCGPLEALALSAGPDVLKSHLMNALVDVANDDSPSVRQAAFPTVIGVCPLMPLDMLRNTGIPLVNKFMKQAFKNNEFIACTIAENYGHMCLSIERGLTGVDKEVYFNWFQSLSSLGNSHCQSSKKDGVFFDHKISLDKLTEIREFCADNFLQMTKFTKGEVERKYSNLLTDCYRCMIADPSASIRRKAASMFSEVLLFYGRFGIFLKQELNMLLTDSADEVLEAAVPQISALVDEFVKLGIYKMSKDLFVLEFVSSLMKCECTLSVSHRWRSYVCLLSQMEIICRTFNTEAVTANFLPLLWKRLTGIRNVPNRRAVFRFIIVILRMSKKEQCRNEIVNRIINELCMSNSFYNRMLFMRCCTFLFETFSMKFVKQNFIINILLMAEDSVANIRWAFVTLLPNITAMLTAEDKALSMRLNAIVQKIEEDLDAEVRHEMAIVKPQLLNLEKDKMFPDDKKKYDAEMLHFSGRKEGMGATPGRLSSVQTRREPIPNKARQFQETTTPRPHVQGAPGTISKSPSSSIRSTTSEISTSSASGSTSTSCLRGELNEKEFLIDAGVSLPAIVSFGALTSAQTPSTCPIRTPTLRRQLPQGAKNSQKRHSTPPAVLPPPPLPLDNSNKPICNDNNNNTNNSPRGVRKSENKTPGSDKPTPPTTPAVSRRTNTSHLPRPLSLYNLPSTQRNINHQHNLPTKHSTTSMASRLPVYRLSEKTAKR